MPTTNGKEQVFNFGIKNNDPRPADTTADFLMTQNADGTQGKILTEDVPLPKPVLAFATDFDPVLSQDTKTLTVNKRIISPESYRFNPSLAPIYGWGDSMTDGFGTTNYPTQLTDLFGYTVTNKGVGGETSTQIKDRFLAEPANFSKSVIIWAGRNNFTNPTTVKTDIATIISNLGHTRYLVVGIVNANTEPKNSTAWNQINALNEELKILYGKKFVPIREYLVSKYNPSLPQDVIDYGNDVTPTSIRLDALHLNTLGNKYVSEVFNQYLGNLFDTEGYMQSKDFKYYFESLEPVHRTGVAFETIEGEKRFSNTQTVESGSTGRGIYVTPVITANANNVKLVGLDVSNVLNAGAFTGVELYQARYEIGIGTSTYIQNKNNSTGAGADARYRLSNSAYNVDFGIRSTGSTSANNGFISVSNASAGFNFFIGGSERFTLLASGALRINTAPVTSAGTYDILTRNSTTGDIEKISSASIAADANVLHKISDEIFTGVKSSTNSGGTSVNGIDLTNNGASLTRVLRIFNTNSEIGQVNANTSTGIGTYSSNLSTGVVYQIESATGSAGDLIQFTKNNVVTAKVSENGSFTTPKLNITTGSNASAGNATLVAGTVTVTTTSGTASSIIILSRKTAGGVVGNITYVPNAGGFTINSDSATDTSTISYLIIN